MNIEKSYFRKHESNSVLAIITSRMIRIIYPIALLLTSLVIWNLLYQAQYLEYDDNYGNILSAFFISLFATIALAVLWLKWRWRIKTFKLITLLFLLTSSPLTIAVVSFNYPLFFGDMLKH